MDIKISFGIIVLNGEPFTRYCLRSIYPFAYEIIVVEGGHMSARAVTTADGHSIDGTLESLLRFKEEEDPEDKVVVITNQGYWPQKDELGRDRTPQCRAYARRATGNYLWQVDIDEFYRAEDITAIIKLISDNPSITALSFQTHTFWGRPEYETDCWALRRGASEYHRLFKWGPGYQYLTHEPPTVLDEKGRDLRTINWIRGRQLAKQGIHMYHYSLLFPGQVKQKTLIYQDEKPDDCKEIVAWAENNYNRIGNPYRVHNLYTSPSWLARFSGVHPAQVIEMMNDIESGSVKFEKRQNEDIENLLNSWWYPVGVLGLKVGNSLDLIYRRLKMLLRTTKHAIRNMIPRVFSG